MWYVFTLGWTGGIVCESAKIDLRQCCLNKTIGISVLIFFTDPNNIPNEIKIMPHISNTDYQISTDICARACVCVCVIFLFCKKHMQCISFDSFSHSANPNIIHTVGITLAQADFCTLTKNASCLSKREHIPHKNYTKWFGIKHFFIKCIIIYCS